MPYLQNGNEFINKQIRSTTRIQLILILKVDCIAICINTLEIAAGEYLVRGDDVKYASVKVVVVSPSLSHPPPTPNLLSSSSL